MRITNVAADIVRIPLSTRFSGSVYQIESRLHRRRPESTPTKDWSAKSTPGMSARVTNLLKDLVVGPMAEAVKGEDPMAIERCWQKMFALTPHVGDKAIAMRAIAAIDIAFVGHHRQGPGRSREGRCWAATPSGRRWCGSPTTCRAGTPRSWWRTCCINGSAASAASNLKVGGVAVADDLLRVRAIRDTLGDDFIIVCRRQPGVDAGRGFGVRRAGQRDGPGVAGRTLPLAERRQRYAPGALAYRHPGSSRTGREQLVGRPTPDGHRGGGHPEH